MARVAGAQELTRRVGLEGTARIIEGNVMDVPLPDASVAPSGEKATEYTKPALPTRVRTTVPFATRQIRMVWS